MLVGLPLVLATPNAWSGEEVAVPVPLQMELLLKVAGYDKNLARRAPSVVRVLVLIKAGDPESAQVSKTAQRALENKTLNRLAVVAGELAWSDGASAARAVREGGVAIVYATPGFDALEMASLAAGLRGISVLSAGALARFAETGVVLAFDLVSGKPKLVVHLGRARAQSVELSSQLLKLARVIGGQA